MNQQQLLIPLLALLITPMLAPLWALEVGVAKVDITPTVTPFQLRSGPSSHVHDPLHVRAIALQSGTGQVVIAIVDAIGVGRDMCDAAKRTAAEATGWKTEHMLVAGTHTHSAPKGGTGSPGREAYDIQRRTGLAQAMIEAIESLQPAKIGFGSDSEPSEVRNRRWFHTEGTEHINPLGGRDAVKTNGGGKTLLKPAGPVDPELSVIDIRTARNKPLGFLANYALHYVGNIPWKIEENDGKRRAVGMASADYFGEFARLMPYRIGGQNPPTNCVMMMSNGASGDINNLPFTRRRSQRAPFEQITIVASKCADAAWRAVQNIESYEVNPTIRMRQREVTLSYRRPSAAEVKAAKRLMALPREERDAINKRTSSVASKTIQYADPEMQRTTNVIVQAVRIGDQAIVALPFEVLVEIGLELKEGSPFEHTMVISHANGGYGYLPPPHQHALGGYETWLGTSRFTKDASVTLTLQLLEMLKEISGG